LLLRDVRIARAGRLRLFIIMYPSLYKNIITTCTPPKFIFLLKMKRIYDRVQHMYQRPSYTLRMMRLVIFSNFLLTISCFTSQRTAMWCPTNHRFVNSGRAKITSRFGSREEEIAKLEDQLRQLREGAAIVEEEGSAKSDMEDQMTLKEFDAARRKLEKMKGKDMLLSEEELISGGIVDGSTNDNSSGLLGVVGVVAALAGLLLFAQIPVGQDELARYSATGSSTIKSIDLGDLNPDTNRQ
jgi:hypothetical protein